MLNKTIRVSRKIFLFNFPHQKWMQLFVIINIVEKELWQKMLGVASIELWHHELNMNFSNYQNSQKLRKFWGIDLYAIMKPSAKFKRKWFTSFEIIPFLIFGRLTCILMGKHNMKKMLLKIQCIVTYQSLWKFTNKGMIY